MYSKLARRSHLFLIRVIRFQKKEVRILNVKLVLPRRSSIRMWKNLQLLDPYLRQKMEMHIKKVPRKSLSY
jgi:hypothetical protein